MGDHPEWPPTPRAMYAGARILAYLMIAVAGLDVAFGQLNRTGQSTNHLWIDIIGVLGAAGGFAALIGALFRWWKVEWIAVAVLTTVLASYTALDWFVLLFVVGYPPVPLALVAFGAGIAVVVAVATGRPKWRGAALVSALVVLSVAIPLAARNPALVTALTAFCAGRYIELWLFSDAAVRARRLRPGARPVLDL